MGNVQTGNGEWVKKPWGVNSIHYPPYLEILYATFKLNRAETVDTTSSSCKTYATCRYISLWTQPLKDLSCVPGQPAVVFSSWTLATRLWLKPIGILLPICLSARYYLGDSCQDLGALAREMVSHMTTFQWRRNVRYVYPVRTC